MTACGARLWFDSVVGAWPQPESVGGARLRTDSVNVAWPRPDSVDSSRLQPGRVCGTRMY